MTYSHRQGVILGFVEGDWTQRRSSRLLALSLSSHEPQINLTLLTLFCHQAKSRL